MEASAWATLRSEDLEAATEGTWTRLKAKALAAREEATVRAAVAEAPTKASQAEAPRPKRAPARRRCWALGR